jgi:hypothetical protein
MGKAESVTNLANAHELRRIAAENIADLLHQARTEGGVDLRRASRRVFEDACLEEVLWESFVDEWIDVAFEVAGDKLAYCDFHSLTDWCKCGHSHDDHRLDCQSCDCERFDRSRGSKRPKQRKRTGYVSPIDANRARCIELENAQYRHLFGDLTGGAL